MWFSPVYREFLCDSLRIRNIGYTSERDRWPIEMRFGGKGGGGVNPKSEIVASGIY